MDNIKFVIPFAPMPYKRLTRNEIQLIKMPAEEVGDALIKDWHKVQAYLKYKRDVFNISIKHDFPRSPSKKLYLHINLYFMNKKHGDPLNYWKAISDAIFKNDKYVAGSFDYYYDVNMTRAQVIISAESGQMAIAPEVSEPETMEDLMNQAF